MSPGEQIAGFRIIAPVAAGGMAVVYEAEQVRLKRRVALKVLNERLGRDQSYRERFIREGTHIASLEHPHIVPVYDAGEEDGRLFIAMRYVDGQTLGDILTDHRMNAEEIDRILTPMARALDAAHKSGIVHRDIKPGNILIDRAGHSFLADFGIARASAATHTLTTVGSFIGSVHYASPEQVRGEALTHASDIYALTVVYYQCIAGEVPYRSDTDTSILDAHMRAPFPPIAESLGGNVRLNEALQTGLAKDPNQRFASASDLAKAVSDATDQWVVAADGGGRGTGSPVTQTASTTPATEGPTPATEGPTPVASRHTPLAPEKRSYMSFDFSPDADPHGTIVVDSTTIDPLDEPRPEEVPAAKRRLSRSTTVLIVAAAAAIAMPVMVSMATGDPQIEEVAGSGFALYPHQSLIRTSNAAAEKFGLNPDASSVFAANDMQILIGPYAIEPKREGGLPATMLDDLKTPASSSTVTADGRMARKFTTSIAGDRFGLLEGLVFLGKEGKSQMVLCMQAPGRPSTQGCGALLGSINVKRKDLVPLAPTTAAQAAVRRLLDSLEKPSAGLSLSMKSRTQRAANADKLSAAYSEAAKATSRVADVSPIEKRLLGKLARGFSNESLALKRLAGAARSKNYGSYARQARRIKAAARDIRSTLRDFKSLG